MLFVSSSAAVALLPTAEKVSSLTWHLQEYRIAFLKEQYYYFVCAYTQIL